MSNEKSEASHDEEEEVEVIVVTMHNEEGEEEEFELIDVVEVNGSRYGVFLPFVEDDQIEAKIAADGEEEEELLLLKLVKDGDVEEFETIDDDVEFDLVAAEVDRLIASGALD